MPPHKEHYRIAIIGSGPAGWTAALYASRAELFPVVFEGPQPGGQLTITTEVENYPGFRDGIQGPELMEIFREQAKRFGTEVVLDTVVDVDFTVRPFRLMLDGGSTIAADAVIVSSGASAKLLGIDADVGTLEAGKVADVVAVPGNVLSDIRATEHPLLVMHLGKVVPLPDAKARAAEMATIQGGQDIPVEVLDAFF